jgi:hypothetical protein
MAAKLARDLVQSGGIFLLIFEEKMLKIRML